MKWLRRILVALVLVALGTGAWLWAELLRPYGDFGSEGVFVEVPRGASLRAIAAQLEQAGVVRSRWAFEAFCRWHSRRLPKAGEYKFDRPRTALEVYDLLAQGRVYVVTLVVPEGRTMFAVADLVAQAGFASREQFLAAAADESLIRELAPGANNLEGFLFPATYQFPRRTPAAEIAAAMVRRFRETWDRLPQRDNPPRGFDALKLVTLASLVERETGAAGERPLISGVFYNRLRLGMALECDPTVIYALQLADRHHGSLTSKDLKVKSLYNTYLHRGLPPGPIANPGKAALRAVLEPATTNYLYFVADAQGSHFFSRTLKEHNANVARYRRLTGDSAAPAEKPSVSRPAKTVRSGRRG